ncbi:fatty acid desaturase [Sphingomonas sp. PvP055]
MNSSDKAAIGKIERLARWTLWPTLSLTVVCLAMLYAGASDITWRWFLPVYLLVGMPIVLGSFVSDVTRLRSICRSRKGVNDDQW